MVICKFMSKSIDKQFSEKRISAKHEDVQTVGLRLRLYYRYFASLPERTDFVFGVEKSKIKILNEHKDVIPPDSVRLHAGDLSSKDLLIHGMTLSQQEIDGLSLFDYEIQMIKWRGFKKQDINDNVTNLAALQTPKSFSEVEEIACYKVKDNIMKFRYLDVPYIPVELDKSVGEAMYRPDYFNCRDVELIVGDYLTLQR